MNAQDIPQRSAADVAKSMAEAQQGNVPAPLLLDVRENWEREIAAIEGSLDVVMNDVPDRLGEIQAAQGDRELVVFCHSGQRSMVIARFLLANGFDRVSNLDGGIDAWSQHIAQSRHLY